MVSVSAQYDFNVPWIEKSPSYITHLTHISIEIILNLKLGSINHQNDKLKAGKLIGQMPASNGNLKQLNKVV
jgi:hypothetical protein